MTYAILAVCNSREQARSLEGCLNTSGLVPSHWTIEIEPAIADSSVKVIGKSSRATGKSAANIVQELAMAFMLGWNARKDCSKQADTAPAARERP